MKAWYFSEENCRLRYDDNRIINAGGTHKVKGELRLCGHGLHASTNILDALNYAPGPVIWRVELGGEILRGDDKCCASERTYLWGYNAEETLRRFARKCALDVIHLWDAPEIVVRYLKTGDESIRDAARDAAWAAAWAAARAAARDAAWAAAWDAARAAAWAAARDAAWAAARDAARDAAWAKQNRRLLAMIRKDRT